MRSDVKAILNESDVRQTVLFERFKQKLVLSTKYFHTLIMTCSWSRLCTSLFFTAELYTYGLECFQILYARLSTTSFWKSYSWVYRFQKIFSRLTLSDFSVFFLRSSVSRSRVFSILFKTFGDWWWKGGGKQVLGYESGAFITGIESNSCVSLTFFYLVS